MNTQTTARIGAALFGLWGLLHVAGGASILAALLDGPDAGYAIYQKAIGPFPDLAGAALGYLAFLIAASGLAVAVVAWRMNWRNSAAGLGLNTAIAGALEVGLVIFLALPGFVSPAEAGIGIGLLVLAATVGGMACSASTHAAGA